MITLNHVSKTIEKHLVLNDIHVTFEKEKTYGIVGRNGSGKSMLFRMLCGLIYPSKGEVTVNGISLKRNMKFPLEIRALIERPCFIENLSGYNNLSMLADIQKQIGKEEIESYLKKFHLFEEKDKPVYQYSLGMKQKLGIIQVLMESPEIMILDEPFAGLDKESVVLVKEILLEEKKKGKTIFLASHIEGDIDFLCDEIYEMDAGRLSKLETK